jgi:hypothetical protein
MFHFVLGFTLYSQNVFIYFPKEKRKNENEKKIINKIETIQNNKPKTKTQNKTELNNNRYSNIANPNTANQPKTSKHND